MRDYVGIADEYARNAVADKAGKRYGQWVRKACARYLDDRKVAGSNGAAFTFDPWFANDACDFIEKLPHVEGVWATPNILMHPSHIFFVVNVFGFRVGDVRRFSTALLAVARKNAKSTLAAAIMLYCLCCEADVGPQCISAATTGQQARIVFNVAKRMVEKTPDLRESFTLEPFAHAIARYDVGGTFKPINSKASTQDGLNPSHTVCDEVHAHKTHDLLNVLRSAAGARANPLWLFTTTEGYESPGPWPELRNFSHQLLDKVVTADHFFALIYAVDEDDDDFDETTWVKANPLMDVNPLLLKELRKMAIDAKAMPGQHAEFKIKRLNRRSAAAAAWVDVPKWQACSGPVDLSWLEQFECYAGLDLASTRDLTAFRLVWRIEGRFYTWGRRWVPADAVAQRTERGTVPYAGWVARGLIEQTDGDVVDYDVIYDAVLEAHERFKIKEVAFDRWNAQDITNRLMNAQVPMVEFVQGTKSYHPAMQALEVAYIAGDLNHGGDEVLGWCAANIVPRRDVNGNLAPDKKRSPDKIDDMTALLMGVGRICTNAPVNKEPTLFFV